jgi:cell division protein FtsB
MKLAARSSKLSRLLSSRTFLLINLLVLAFLVFSFSREFLRDYSLRQEIAELEAEEADLKSENSDLAALMDSIQTETYIEREARLKLGLVKPGENVIVLPDSSIVGPGGAAGVLAAPPAPEDLAAVANPRKWWYYFFDINKFNLIKVYGK